MGKTHHYAGSLLIYVQYFCDWLMHPARKLKSSFLDDPKLSPTENLKAEGKYLNSLADFAWLQWKLLQILSALSFLALIVTAIARFAFGNELKTAIIILMIFTAATLVSCWIANKNLVEKCNEASYNTIAYHDHIDNNQSQ
jgi:hypothetical protein